VEALTEKIGAALTDRGALLSVAESCTGGWLAQVLTSVPGSSRWFERGYVTYSNLSKQELLGVEAATIAEHGAVSSATALEMAAGVLARTPAQFSVAITGIAGPDGGTPSKPVGTVFIAWGRRGVGAECRHCTFPGDRTEVRRQAVVMALHGLLERVGS
jgi:nicotinamide-nucleotide amidase